MAEAILQISPERLNELFRYASNQLYREKLRMRLPGQKLHKLANVMDAGSASDYYTALTSNWLTT